MEHAELGKKNLTQQAYLEEPWKKPDQDWIKLKRRWILHGCYGGQVSVGTLGMNLNGEVIFSIRSKPDSMR